MAASAVQGVAVLNMGFINFPHPRRRAGEQGFAFDPHSGATPQIADILCRQTTCVAPPRFGSSGTARSMRLAATFGSMPATVESGPTGQQRVERIKLSVDQHLPCRRGATEGAFTELVTLSRYPME
jgi:hypothetical protein